MVWHSIPRYIIKQSIPFFFIGYLFFELLLLIQIVFRLVEMNVEQAVPMSDIFQLFLYSIPFTSMSALPLGVLVAVVVSLGTLSNNSEIVAMRAAGMSVLRIFYPTFIIGLVTLVLSFAFIEYLVPWGNKRYIEVHVQAMQVNPVRLLTSQPEYPANASQKYKIWRGDIDVEKGILYDVKIRLQGNPSAGQSASSNMLHLYADQAFFLPKDPEQNAFPLVLENVRTIPFHYEGHYANQSGRARNEEPQSFITKYSEREIFNIPDPKNNRSLGESAKAQSITYLLKRMRERRRMVAARGLRGANEMVHSEIKLKRLQALQTEVENGNIPDWMPQSGGNDPQEDDPQAGAGSADEQAEQRVQRPRTSDEQAEQMERQRRTRPPDVPISPSEQIEQQISQTEKKLEKREQISVDSENRIADDPMLRSFKYELHLKIALPFACLVFVLIGAPMGISGSARSAKSLSLGLAMLVGIVWLVVRIGLIEMNRLGLVMPWQPGWMANIVVGQVGIIVFLLAIRK